jgi:dihydroorotate dehydrogenase (NAD+) catalytic subunit
LTRRLETGIGRTPLKNPLIAAAAEHLIEEEGVRRAILAGAGAVVVKSTNESEAAKEQLRRAEYVALGANWEVLPWGPETPAHATLATRSGLSPLPFDAWLEQSRRLDGFAREHDCLLVASLILAELDTAIELARKVEQAGLRVLELNIGTPYAKEAAKGAVSTELVPERVRAIVAALRAKISLPLWIKITGQSERVPELAEAAFAAGADAVVMAGRLLGLVPSLETLEPMLGTSLGIGGFWNLPLTCHWLALSRARLGKDRPLIGINGAKDGYDMARMMLAGASAVGFASAVMLRGFEVISQSLDELDGFLAAKSLTARELIGHAADRRRSFGEMPLLQDHWRRFIPRQAGAKNGPKD